MEETMKKELPSYDVWRKEFMEELEKSDCSESHKDLVRNNDWTFRGYYEENLTPAEAVRWTRIDL